MKKVSKTITEILEDPYVKQILDRSANMEEVIPYVSGLWRFDMYSKNPTPPYFNKEGAFVPTDLPLSDVLYSMIGAVIKIPYYKSLREKKSKEGQQRVGTDRFGEITSLYANKETLTCGVQILDRSVISARQAGDFRKFALVDFDGEWYDGWRTIQIMPTAEENKFLTESKLWTENKVIFRNFVHPLRWVSVYGKPYFMTKLLIDRLTEEAQFYNQQIKKILDSGITYPPSDAPTVWPDTEPSGEKKSIKVKAFSIDLDMPANSTKFPEYENTQENLVKLTSLRKFYIYKMIPQLRFATRASEIAFYKHMKTKGWNSFPGWIDDAKWEEGYKKKGGRTAYNRFVWFQPKEKDEKGQFQSGISYLARDWEKSESVSPEYVE